MEKRIKWLHNHHDIYTAYDNKFGYLGLLQYERVGKFMHWCWYQADDVRMSPGCLQEVRDKQKEVFNLRNRNNKNK